MERQESIHRMLSWLSFSPTLENVARALVLDYFAPMHASEATIWHLDKKDSLTCLAAFGNSDTSVGVPIPGSQWRSDSATGQFATQAFSKHSPVWSEGNSFTIVNIYAQSLLIGFISIRFAQPVEDTENLNAEIELFAALISLYVSLRFPDSLEQVSSMNGEKNSMARLTPRQRSVLQGITQKKTNSAIAKELGYSVSTIRHETMRIFETLGVSDRVEAAAHANKFRML